MSPRFVAALEHDALPFVSYPYEWSFAMLRDAALLTLDLLLAALEESLTLKDASPFNVQLSGARPLFIDSLLRALARRRAVGRLPPVLPAVPLSAPVAGVQRRRLPAVAARRIDGIGPEELAR